MAALPLLAHDRLLGAMGLNFPDGRVLSDEDLAFIDAIIAATGCRAVP